MQLTKFRYMELKHSALSHFCIQSYGNNVIIENPVMEAIVLQPSTEADVAEQFPYATVSVDVPQEQPTTKLLKDINMRRIYDNSLVEEQQELGLDPIFVAEFSIEPIKPRLQQAQHSPAMAVIPMLAIISTYGACHILTKNSIDRLWKKEVGNLTKLLLTEVFPIQRSPCDLKTFTELRDFINLYVITACTWHSCGSIIYTSNAAGYIIAFKMEFNSMEEDATDNIIWSFMSKASADIGRINYLKAFDDYLIAVSVEGVIRLYKFIKDDTRTGKFEFSETLWKQKDRMSCRQIVVQKCRSDNSYMILFAKGAHVICMRISDESKVESSSSLYVPGIKVTGLELFHENELIVTTVSGHIFRVSFSTVRGKDASVSLRLKADPVSTPNLDSENIQILGVGTSVNKALWLFMTHRNKEMPVSTKQPIYPSHLVLCKPSTLDALAQLTNIPIDTIDPYEDLVLALRLDVWHSNMGEKFDQTFSLLYQTLKEKTLDDTFLRNLQIQLEIARVAFRRSSYKLQIIDEVISGKIEFLELAIQVIHVLLRLEYLQGIIDNERITNASAGLFILTDFQQKSVCSMRKKFDISIEKLKSLAGGSSKKDEIIKLKDIVFDFVDLAFESLRNKSQDFEIISSTGVEEKCLFCHELLDDGELICRFGHNLIRCCVSFVQLPWFNNRFCPKCGTMAMAITDSHNALAELFPPKESVKCTFCRSKFVDKKSA